MTVATEHPTADNPALVLDILEAAHLLRCGRSTIYKLLDGGHLTGIKIGRRRLVTYASVSAFVGRQSAGVAHALGGSDVA